MLTKTQLVTPGAPSVKAMWTFAHVRRDAGYAIRQLRRSPGFALITVLTLALGIGANAAIFSLVEGALLRPLPYPQPDRLVVVWQADALHRDSGAYFNSYREFEMWQRHSRSFEKLAAVTWATGPRTMLWEGKPLEMLAIPASLDLFSMLGKSAAMGRTFAESDLRSPCALVLADRFWKQNLAAPRDIVGRSLSVSGTACQIVGVMSKDFSFYPTETDAWMLLAPTGQLEQKPWNTMVGAFGRLKPGVTRAAAEGELAAIQKQVIGEVPGDLKIMSSLAPDVLDLQSNFTWLAGRNLRKGLWMLLGASILILLLASVNVGGLVLSRSLTRSREMAIRAAIGASRLRLIVQVMMEALLLASAGTLAGLAAAFALLQWFRAATPIELPPGANIGLDGRVLAFTALSGISAAILFGLFPAWRASRADVNTVLKSGNPHAAHSRGAQRATQTMVVIQVALSMILLAGAGLLSESLWRMAATDLGYRTDHLFTARIHLPENRYADAAARGRVAQALETSLAAIPAVRSVAFGSDFVPGGESPLSIYGRPESRSGYVANQDVSAGAPATLGIPLLRGRTFDARDQKDTQPVAVINEAAAKKYFAGLDPLGQAIKLGRADDSSKPWLTIIGVVGDVKTTTVFQEMGYVERAAVYRPLTQSAPLSLALMVAVNGSPLALVSEIQQRLSRLDPDLVLGSIDALRKQQAAALSQPRFRSLLLSGFAALALTLALVGLYGVLSQGVARKSHDIGIRMALGADRTRILRSVLGQACAMTGTGIVVGAVLAAAGVRGMRGMLYGIPAQGAGELCAAAAGMLAVTLAAAWMPAFRAASVDPVRVLRDQ